MARAETQRPDQVSVCGHRKEVRCPRRREGRRGDEVGRLRHPHDQTHGLQHPELPRASSMARHVRGWGQAGWSVLSLDSLRGLSLECPGSSQGGSPHATEAQLGKEDHQTRKEVQDGFLLQIGSQGG
jgi:hypothetical protein